MKSYGVILFFIVIYVCSFSCWAQSDSLKKTIEREQSELRARQLFLQRRKDSLDSARTVLQAKIETEKRKKEEAARKKYKHVVALDPVYDLLYLGFEASYEQALNSKQSLYISLGFYDYYGVDEYREADKSYLKASMGYRCLVEYRVYAFPESAMFSGFYTGPMVFYKQRSEEVSVNIKDSLTYYSYHYENQTRFGSALGIGLVAGYQIPLGKRFLFDSYVQLGGVVNLGARFEAENIGRPLWDPYNSSAMIGTGVSLGYKF